MPLDRSEYLSGVWKDGLFKNKVVFCTGGNGSICSAQVRALVYLGANACIVGRNTEKTHAVAKDLETARSGSKVLGIGGIDVRSYESLERAVDQCVRELGRIDFLIAGAAGNFLAPMRDLSANAMKSVIDIDVLGSYNVTKACLPHLVKAAKENPYPSSTPSGRVVYISATFHYTGKALQTHVSVAKAGVDALSHNVCIEYGPLGITSNVITPGPIKGTEGMDRLAKKRENGERAHDKSIPAQRYGTIKDIADATVYLFSDAANYVNGEVLVVDGGSWRTAGSNMGGFEYPDFLMGSDQISGVGGMRKSKGAKL